MDTFKDSRYPGLVPPQRRSSSVLPWLIRLPLLGMTALMLLAFLAVIGIAMHQLQFGNVIYPGMSAYGVSLSGLTKDQAMAALSARYTYGENAIFTFRDGEKSWQMSARDLGISYDPQETVETAYKVGRAGGLLTNLADQFSTWKNGYSIQPTVVFDQSKASAFLDNIAKSINTPVKDALIALNGTTVSTTPSQVGRELDVNSTLDVLRPIVMNMSTGAEIKLNVKETQPALKDAEAAATQVRAALSSPIQIYIEAATKTDPGPWQVSPNFLAGMMSITRVNNPDGTAQYAVKANTAPLKNFLQSIAPQLSVDPVNARFLFNEDTKQLELLSDSVNGRSLNIDDTMKTLGDTIFKKDDRRVALAFQQDVPKVNSKSTAKDLGITEKIVSATTFFYGSTADRRTNIQVAAAKFHGLVIAPGEEFSFNDYLGDVSPEQGYETGLVIYGGQTIAGVGGGVCQVSTTVFQAAFFAGFPIKERYAHGYRVGYYESGTVIAGGQKYNSGVGLDATVYGPIIDLKWVNDSPYYLLITTDFEASAQSLTVNFYSTGTGRVVTKDGPTLSNQVPHLPTKYQESADLKPGQSRQVDYAVDGVDTHVYRTITQNGQVVVDKEDFYSHYLPWAAVFQVAPGYAHN